MSDKIVTFDRQGNALGRNDSDGERPGGDNNEDGANLDGVNVPLTAAQKKDKKQIQKKKYKSPCASGNTSTFDTNSQNLKTTRNFHNPQSFVLPVVSRS